MDSLSHLSLSLSLSLLLIIYYLSDSDSQHSSRVNTRMWIDSSFVNKQPLNRAAAIRTSTIAAYWLLDVKNDAQNDPKMTQKWHQNDAKMTPKWRKNDTKMTQKWHQYDAKMKKK